MVSPNHENTWGLTVSAFGNDTNN